MTEKASLSEKIKDILIDMSSKDFHAESPEGRVLIFRQSHQAIMKAFEEELLLSDSQGIPTKYPEYYDGFDACREELLRRIHE